MINDNRLFKLSVAIKEILEYVQDLKTVSAMVRGKRDIDRLFEAYEQGSSDLYANLYD